MKRAVRSAREDACAVLIDPINKERISLVRSPFMPLPLLLLLVVVTILFDKRFLYPDIDVDCFS